MSFEPFPKMARLSREAIITEKIDGSNAQIYIIDLAAEQPSDELLPYVVALSNDGKSAMLAGSRTRWVTPGKQSDNMGWAGWVAEHADELWALGPGRHFGEWWGKGIQRGYDLQEKRFSLFNVTRWCGVNDKPQQIPMADPRIVKMQERAPACCGLVPILYRGEFSTGAAYKSLETLAIYGSKAAPGFMQPEGIVVYHVAGNVGFKKTLEGDGQPKSLARS